MKILRRNLLVLVPVAVLGLLAAGIASAQSQPPKAPQTREEADKAKAEAAQRSRDDAAKAEAERKAEARKPKRGKSDRKDPERELEEEEDI